MAAAMMDAIEAEKQNSPFPWKRNPKEYKTARALEPGFAWNPLRKWPANAPCFCGTTTKAKKCCLPKVRPTIPKKMYEQVSSVVDQVRKQFK
jgi:hypothetical protein